MNDIPRSIRRAIATSACLLATASLALCADDTNAVVATTNQAALAAISMNTTSPATSSGQTPGDLVLMGQSAVVEEGETISGSTVVVGGNLTILGKVNQDAVCVGGKLKVGPKAHIGGDLVTVGSVADIDSSAKIGGSKVNVASFPVDIMKRLSPMSELHGKTAREEKPRHDLKRRAGFFLFLEIAFFALLLFIALLMATFLPAQLGRITEHLIKDFGRSALLGLAVMVVFPIVLLMLIVTVVGLPLVPLLVLAVVVGQLVGYVALGYALGRRWFDSRGQMAQAIIGLAVLQSPAILGDIIAVASGHPSPLAFLLGALGMLIFIVGSFTGLGALISSSFSRLPLMAPQRSDFPPIQS